ncbi:PTS sugar transporter subunit IIA [Fusobacterium sp.]|uniref:PTS sugar transporter subunit IIA n=1 Tax=Fusobacterium sp. TaxID=68766 RepID=UPI0025B9FC53|nr:PTS sugar transporter subunit IIA [Fusobacterium sp.]
MFEEKYIFRIDKKMTRDEVLEKVGNEFLKDGIVNEKFIVAVKKRENEYPTGLILEGGTKTAISHSDDEYVLKDKIAIILSKEPVVFKSIDDLDKEVECNVFFVMALTKENKNDILVVLMDLFEQYEEKLKNFINMSNQEILEFLM